MPVPRPSQETLALFRSVVPEAPGVTVRPMFGNVAAFVNGAMFAEVAEIAEARGLAGATRPRGAQRQVSSSTISAVGALRCTDSMPFFAPDLLA
ncbi:hypothetical protein LLS1_05820 [Leifsonia sp. LS1]|nr:hypothetical protein LLS1_05820 [Leifsonia sp. LS1]